MTAFDYIKTRYAVKLGYDSFDKLIKESFNQEAVNSHYRKVSELYAKACCDATIENILKRVRENYTSKFVDDPTEIVYLGNCIKNENNIQILK